MVPKPIKILSSQKVVRLPKAPEGVCPTLYQDQDLGLGLSNGVYPKRNL